jgi:hypothetical protein
MDVDTAWKWFHTIMDLLNAYYTSIGKIFIGYFGAYGSDDGPLRITGEFGSGDVGGRKCPGQKVRSCESSA